VSGLKDTIATPTAGFPLGLTFYPFASAGAEGKTGRVPFTNFKVFNGKCDFVMGAGGAVGWMASRHQARLVGSGLCEG